MAGEEAEVAAAPTDTIQVAPAPPPPERIELGDLSAEDPLGVEGYVLTLENPHEGSVLTYRHDPGVPLLYIAITAFILGLAIRTYWPSYRVSLWIEESPGGAVGRLTFRATGILGEPEMAEDELAAGFGGELKAPPEPPEPAPAAPPSQSGLTPPTPGETGQERPIPPPPPRPPKEPAE
jgi:hypothetical protein